MFVCVCVLTYLMLSASTGAQTGPASSSGTSQMQAWVQGAIAKISSNSDGTSSTPNPISGPSTPFMPISINTGTFPGTPAVRLIGDCHFLHRLCQLLLFCFFFRKKQLRLMGGAQRNPDSNLQKNQPGIGGKVEETNTVTTRPSASGIVRSEEGQGGRSGQVVPGAKGLEEGPAVRQFRLGSGNAGQGYTSEEVTSSFCNSLANCLRTPYDGSVCGSE